MQKSFFFLLPFKASRTLHSFGRPWKVSSSPTPKKFIFFLFHCAWISRNESRSVSHTCRTWRHVPLLVQADDDISPFAAARGQLGRLLPSRRVEFGRPTYSLFYDQGDFHLFLFTSCLIFDWIFIPPMRFWRCGRWRHISPVPPGGRWNFQSVGAVCHVISTLLMPHLHSNCFGNLKHSPGFGLESRDQWAMASNLPGELYFAAWQVHRWMKMKDLIEFDWFILLIEDKELVNPFTDQILFLKKN